MLIIDFFKPLSLKIIIIIVFGVCYQHLFAQQGCGSISFRKDYLGDKIGWSGFLVDDTDSDGINEIISTGQSFQFGGGLPPFTFIYALNYNKTTKDYKIKWVSEIFGTPESQMDAFDITMWQKPNGSKEFFVLFQSGLVCSFDGKTFKKISSFFVSSLLNCSDIEVTDANNDGKLELVALTYDSLKLFSLETKKLIKSYSVPACRNFGWQLGNADKDKNKELFCGDAIYEIVGDSVKMEWRDENGILGDGKVRLLDIDSDGIDEIVTYRPHAEAISISSHVRDKVLASWYYNNIFDFNVVDVNKNGKLDILYTTHDSIICVEPYFNKQLWAISSGGHNGATGITITDTDNDKVNELLLGTGSNNSSDADTLKIFDLKNLKQKFQTEGGYGGEHRIRYQGNQDKDDCAVIKRWSYASTSYSSINSVNKLTKEETQIYKSRIDSYIGNIYYADVNQDGKKELIILGFFDPNSEGFKYTIKIYDYPSMILRKETRIPGHNFFAAHLIHENNIPKLIIMGEFDNDTSTRNPDRLYKINLSTLITEANMLLGTKDDDDKSIYAIQYGDVTGDNKPDYVVNKSLLQILDGTTGKTTEFCRTNMPYCDDYSALALLDLNKDKILDIITTDNRGNLFGVYMNSNTPELLFEKKIGEFQIHAVKHIKEFPKLLFILSDGYLKVFDIDKREIICQSDRLFAPYSGILNELEHRINNNYLYFIIGCPSGIIEYKFPLNSVTYIKDEYELKNELTIYPTPAYEYIKINN
jgi:hypothetical protein